VERYSDSVVTDMAKRRSIKRALRRADKPPPPEHDALPDLLFVVDSKGRICDLHPDFGTLFRLPSANFVGRTVSDFLPETTAAIISDAIAEARQRGMNRGSVYPLDTPTGLRWFELSIVPWQGDKVPQGSLIAVARDITKRKLAEDDAREKELALRESEEHLRTVADFTFNWENWFDPSGALLWVSPSVERVTGYSPEDCYRMTGFFEPLVYEEDREDFRREFAVAAAGASGEGITFRFRRKDGEMRWASASYRSVLDVKGRRIGHRSCVLDITERRQAETALRQSEEMSRAILEQAAEGFVLINERGILSVWNLAMEKLSGVDRVDVLGRFIWDVQFELSVFLEQKTKELHAQLKQKWHETLRTGQSSTLRKPVEATIMRADGESRTYERVLFPIDIGNRRMFGCLIHETTERNCTEEALRTSQARLRALSHRIESVREETQSQIAREIHDSIGQSVSGIAMSLGWIARMLSPTVDSEVSQELKDMETVLSGLTTKVQEMTMRLRPQILDDLGLKEAITVEVQGFSERTNIQGTVSVSLPPQALDAAGNTAVFRICQEALTNVYRHAKATAVLIVLYEQEDRILFAVSDNGCGITDEQVRAPKSLGILGMQERALALGGEIDFTGQPGAGTTVTLSLPIARKSGNRRRRPL